MGDKERQLPSLEERVRSSSRASRSGRASPARSASGSLIRSSMMQSQAAKRAKKVRFYRNGDRFFRGMVIAVSPERFRTFESLMTDLTSSAVGDRKVLPNGVRHIFSLDGSAKILDLSQLEDGESYVCASTQIFKELDYAQGGAPTWNRGSESPSPGPGRRSTTPSLQRGGSTHDIDDENLDFVKPRLITVIRNGTRPRKAIRLLLNRKTVHSFEQVLHDISETIQLDSGPVKRIFTLDGNPVRAIIPKPFEKIIPTGTINNVSRIQKEFLCHQKT